MGAIERSLLLCMAYPDYSEKYGATVCRAGITESGELRRIYPVPFDTFTEVGFQKRYWIEYEIREKGDYRKESYKIEPESVEIGSDEDYLDVRNRLEERATSIDCLNSRQDEDETSLGFVKPENVSLSIDEDEDRRQHAQQYNQQQTLTGGSLPVDVIPHQLRYHFNCSEDCSTDHSIMCEDIEIGMLYWKLREEYDDIDTVEEKLSQKFVDWMMEERDLYFMLGTHFNWGSWLIVSVLYPEARSSQDLTDFAG